MDKILNFFNKIMGLMIFLIAVTLIVLLFHLGHHGRGWHHRHFKDGYGNKDSITKSYRDSADKK
jgi:hypothetical protein